MARFEGEWDAANALYEEFKADGVVKRLESWGIA